MEQNHTFTHSSNFVNCTTSQSKCLEGHILLIKKNIFSPQQNYFLTKLKTNPTNLELSVEVTEASDVLVDLFRVASIAFCATCSLRAWFCCCSFSQFTRALCSASNSSKGLRRPGTARRNERACVWKELVLVSLSHRHSIKITLIRTISACLGLMCSCILYHSSWLKVSTY